MQKKTPHNVLILFTAPVSNWALELLEVCALRL